MKPNSHFWLLALCLLVIIVVSLLTLIFLGNRNGLDISPTSYKSGVSPVKDTAVAQARKVFQEKKKDGVDLTEGPCLTNDLLKNWVLDIVHNPRTKTDDLAQNQCQAFLEGRATHFVEMDLEGNIVRVK